MCVTFGCSRFELLDFQSRDAMLLRDMPFHHKDPFDRMLIAQAIANEYHLMTEDSKFAAYDCRLLKKSLNRTDPDSSNLTPPSLSPQPA